MEDHVHIVDCYYVTVRDRPGEGHRLLERLSEQGVSLLAFTAIPGGSEETQLCLVTDEPDRLEDAASEAGTMLTGPKKAFLIQGEDRIGALHDYHQTLANANVNVFSSSGVCSGEGRFGFVLWVEPPDLKRALDALGMGD